MPMRVIRTVYVTGVLALLAASGVGNVNETALAESTPEGKSETPPVQRPKDPDTKPKEPEPKTKEADSKPKESDAKPPEKPKEAEAKPKEPESKVKEPETKAKDQEPKAKEPAAKAKESEHKVKEAEPKSKEPESKAKEPDAAAEHPCPTVPHAAEVKPAAETQAPPGEPGAGERPKAAEPEGKKPIRSSMVTAKLALMADPHLFPYDIEVDAKDKDLVLLGKVSQESDKRVATDIVRCLDGVHAVENRLKVEQDAAHGLFAERDKIITQLVKERFEKSKTLQSVKFDVKTEDGIVTLNGATRF
ncbi:MAG: BON domain-containing protein, partial [Nitrospira sp.]|nr:BON domain-containing protein [Nitrospira sp.]